MHFKTFIEYEFDSYSNSAVILSHISAFIFRIFLKMIEIYNLNTKHISSDALYALQNNACKEKKINKNQTYILKIFFKNSVIYGLK